MTYSELIAQDLRDLADVMDSIPDVVGLAEVGTCDGVAYVYRLDDGNGDLVVRVLSDSADD